jgi:hypothetical protein
MPKDPEEDIKKFIENFISKILFNIDEDEVALRLISYYTKYSIETIKTWDQDKFPIIKRYF